MPSADTFKKLFNMAGFYFAFQLAKHLNESRAPSNTTTPAAAPTGATIASPSAGGSLNLTSLLMNGLRQSKTQIASKLEWFTDYENIANPTTWLILIAWFAAGVLLGKFRNGTLFASRASTADTSAAAPAQEKRAKGSAKKKKA